LFARALTRSLVPPPLPYTTLFRSMAVGLVEVVVRDGTGRHHHVHKAELDEVAEDLPKAAGDQRARAPEKDRGLRVEHHPLEDLRDRKSTRLNSSHQIISYAVFCLN